MRKMIAVFLCVGLSLFTAACAPGAASPPLDAASSEASSPRPSQQSPDSLPPEEEPGTDAPREKLFVADAAMYRGTITSIREAEAATLLTLEQAKGTDFGAASVEALLPTDAPLSFPADQLAEGGYLEIYYGGSLDSQPVTVIAANLYPSAEMVNFNGVVEEIRPESEGNGTLVLRDIENGQQVVYHYSGEQTQLYLDLTQLKPDDQLNIFHRGIYTMSLPPQGSALEIRKIAEPLPVAPAQPDPFQIPASSGTAEPYKQ